MKGKIVSAIPQAGNMRGPVAKIDWDSPAKLARTSGQPVLAAKHVRNSRIKSLRQSTRSPFVTDEGRIIVTMRNSTVDPVDGERYGDVYMTWEPTKKASK